jgi:ABC-type branched-subunit amino acid transport system substrate-binding protein
MDDALPIPTDDDAQATPPPAAEVPVSRRRFLSMAGAGAAGGLIAACSGHRRAAPPRTTAVLPSTSTTVGKRTIRIGYVAEITGPNASRGQLVKAAVDAFSGYLSDKLGGSYLGLTPSFVPADAPHTADDGQRALNSLVSQKVDAVLWCTPFGLAENLAAVTSAGLPVLSVFADLYSYAGNLVQLTGSQATGSLVFQTMLPDVFALDAMLAYAAEDRGFASAGLIYDAATYPQIGPLFTAAATRRGLANAGGFSYDSTSGSVDLTGPLQALKRAKAQVVMCYGLADQVSSIAAHLQSLDAKYIDTPSAKRSFKPMVMGPRWGTGDVDYARLGGDAAARGTLTAGALGSIVTLPTMPMRKWLHDYRPDYNAGFPRGGEDSIADGAAALVAAAKRAGTTSGPALVSALEAGDTTKVASGVGIAFAADRHLAVTKDDTALLTLEFPPDPYNLGTEWTEVLPEGYVGPTHLIDYALAANTRAHADVMQDILSRRYGTSATDDYQGGDPVKVAACKLVH